MTARTRSTVLGLLALAGWATSNALTRSLVEALGPLTVLAVGFGGGGLVLALAEVVRHRSPRRLVAVSPAYLLLAGACFVGYCGSYAFAYHLAPDDDTALVLGLVNYLWPSFLLAFLPLFLGRRARWPLPAGIALAFLGLLVAAPVADGAAADLPDRVAQAAAAVAAAPGAFALMLLAAVLWGLYSNLARKLGPAEGPGGVPLFALATGFVFLVARFATGEASAWSPDLAGPLAVQVVLTCGLCYLFWDVGVRTGDLVLLGAASYALPVAATLFACAWLDRPLTPGLAVGALLVAAGAVLGRRGVGASPRPPTSARSTA